MGGGGRLPMSLFPRAWEQGGTSHSTILAIVTAHLLLPGPRPENSELGLAGVLGQVRALGCLTSHWVV